MAKTLREGFTTGTAAAAAAKASCLALLTGKLPESVSVALPPFVDDGAGPRQDGGGRLEIPVAGGEICADSRASVRIIKDGGDDPDATHGAVLRVLASYGPPPPSFRAGPGRVLVLPGDIRLHTGAGVGVATLPGLPVAVGDPAVNPQPRLQIAFAVGEALRQTGASRPPDLYLDVPDGENRARHTLNARLGILGGISILGTRGTVRPYSHESWQATISQGMAVAQALGIEELLLSTGRRSERLGFALFPHVPPQAGIQVADYAAYSLREAARGRFRRLRWLCFPGKLLKLAQGLEWTHAKSGTADISLLATLSREAGGSAETVAGVAAMPTAAGAFGLLAADAGLHDAVLRRLGDRAYARLGQWLSAACRENGTAPPGLSLHVFALAPEGGPASLPVRPLMEWGEGGTGSPLA